MNVATLWLPIVGGILLGGIAVAAWFADKKIAAVWFGFAGIVCFLLLAAMQAHEYLATPNSAANPNEIAEKQLRAYMGLLKPTSGMESNGWRSFPCRSKGS